MANKQCIKTDIEFYSEPIAQPQPQPIAQMKNATTRNEYKTAQNKFVKQLTAIGATLHELRKHNIYFADVADVAIELHDIETEIKRLHDAKMTLLRNATIFPSF
jgi:hypothetical protein